MSRSAPRVVLFAKHNPTGSKMTPRQKIEVEQIVRSGERINALLTQDKPDDAPKRAPNMSTLNGADARRLRSSTGPLSSPSRTLRP